MNRLRYLLIFLCAVFLSVFAEITEAGELIQGQPQSINISCIDDLIEISWDPVPLANQYRIYGMEYPSGPSTLLGITENLTWTCDIADKKYFFKVTSAQPKATVIFTFDDGLEDLYTNALPIMERYSLKGTAYVITGLIGSSNYLNWDQLLHIQGQGWEIGSHSVSHEDMTELSDEEVNYELQNSMNELLSHQISVKTFAPPSRKWNDELAVTARKYYKAVRAGDLLQNLRGLGKDHCYIRSVNRSVNENQLENVISWIDNAILNEEICILLFHKISDTQDPYSISLESFEEITKYCSEKVNDSEIQVMTFLEMINKYK